MKKGNIYTLVFFISIALFNCGEPKKCKINVIFDDIENLELQSEVVSECAVIGFIESIKTIKTKLLITIILNKGITLREKSTFRMEKPGLLGPMIIEVTNGASTNRALTEKDTLYGISPEIPGFMEADSLPQRKVNGIMDTATTLMNKIKLTLHRKSRLQH